MYCSSSSLTSPPVHLTFPLPLEQAWFRSWANSCLQWRKEFPRAQPGGSAEHRKQSQQTMQQKQHMHVDTSPITRTSLWGCTCCLFGRA